MTGTAIVVVFAIYFKLIHPGLLSNDADILLNIFVILISFLEARRCLASK